MEKTVAKKKDLSVLFQISLIIKEIDAVIEVVGGFLVLFTSKVVLVTFILNFFQDILTDNPKDYVANFIVNSAAELSISSQYFLGAYLLAHGVIKIVLIINLLGKKLWAYFATMIIFPVFIAYELYGFYLSHSLWTLALTLFDILIVVFTIKEYFILKNNR